MRRYTRISKEEFESFLASVSVFDEFPPHLYEVDWDKKPNGEWKKIEIIIKEYCYVLPLDSELNTCIKVYSSIDRNSGFSRNTERDSIKIVVASSDTGKPIREKFTHIYRIQTWRKNLRSRILDAFKSVGQDTSKCLVCRHPLVPRKRGKDGLRFLGCSQYPKCMYTRSIRI